MARGPRRGRTAFTAGAWCRLLSALALVAAASAQDVFIKVAGPLASAAGGGGGGGGGGSDGFVTATIGGTVQMEFEVGVDGRRDASNVQLFGDIQGSEVDSISPPPPVCTSAGPGGGGCSPGSLVRCDWGSMAAGSKVTVTVNLRVYSAWPPPTKLRVTSDRDTDTQNNEVSVVTQTKGACCTGMKCVDTMRRDCGADSTFSSTASCASGVCALFIPKTSQGGAPKPQPGEGTCLLNTTAPNAFSTTYECMERVKRRVCSNLPRSSWQKRQACRQAVNDAQCAPQRPVSGSG